MVEKQEKSKFKKFIDENRSLIFTVPVFVVLAIVLVMVYVLGGNNDNTSETNPPAANTPLATAESAEPSETSDSNNGQEVTTLPDDEREKSPSEIQRNPFAEPYKVSGIIYDSKGDSLAIIEAENKSYIVEAGDEGDGYFTVVSIERDQEVLEVGGMEMILTVSGE
jgi:hypothetical protein